MSTDLKAALRKRKPARRTSQIGPCRREDLVDLADLLGAPLLLVLDTNIYIDHAAGRLAPAARTAVDQALLFHCSVALAELAIGVANADPSRPGWSVMQSHYTDLFGHIPASRVVTPDAQVWIDAGVIAGTLARTQGFQPHQRQACLADALIFLTAAKAGIPVLTADRDHFDIIQQLAPEGRFIHC